MEFTDIKINAFEGTKYWHKISVSGGFKPKNVAAISLQNLLSVKCDEQRHAQKP